MKYNALLFIILSVSITLMFLVSCEHEIVKTEPDADKCRANGITTRKYSLEIKNRWTQANFPTRYVSNAHFSPFVVFSHRSDFYVFEKGESASSKLEELAETGATDIISDLYDNNIKDVGCGVKGNSMFSSDGPQTIEIPVNTEYNTITILSMIAPSSDWFVAGRIQLGVDGNPATALPKFMDWLAFGNDPFKKSGSIDLKNYDAGTEQDAIHFSLKNEPEPHQKDIEELTSPFNSNDVLAQVEYKLLP